MPANLLAIVALIGLGLAPYLTLFQSSPDFSISGPIETSEDFLRYVTRAACTDRDELAGVSDKISYQLWLLELSALQFTFALGLLAGLGFIFSSKLLRRCGRGKMCVSKRFWKSTQAEQRRLHQRIWDWLPVTWKGRFT